MIDGSSVLCVGVLRSCYVSNALLWFGLMCVFLFLFCFSSEVVFVSHVNSRAHFNKSNATHNISHFTQRRAQVSARMIRKKKKRRTPFCAGVAKRKVKKKTKKRKANNQSSQLTVPRRWGYMPLQNAKERESAARSQNPVNECGFLQSYLCLPSTATSPLGAVQGPNETEHKKDMEKS